MKPTICCAVLLVLTACSFAQLPEVKFIADTLVVQAEGTYEVDPDLATLTFRIFSQDKEIKRAYDAATQSIQRIADLAQRNGLNKEDVTSGALTVTPFYEGDRRKRARSYSVQGETLLRLRDFSKIASILDGSVDDGVADFRSLTYSLADEEAAKKQAVAEAMRRAVGRASIALEQKGQKLGALRYMNLDVKQLYGIARVEEDRLVSFETTTSREGIFGQRKTAPPPPPPPASRSQPEKVTVSASVQCAFQIL